MKWGKIFVYDLCYSLLPRGSFELYTMRNDVEINIAAPGETAMRQAAAAWWRRDPQFKWLRQLADCFGELFVVPFHQEIHLSEETSILHHIATHHQSLPDVVILLHPDFYEHVSRNAMETVLRSLSLRQWPPETSFLHLGHRHNGPEDEFGRVGSEVRTYCSVRPGAAGRSSQGATGKGVFAGVTRLERTSTREPSGNFCLWYEFIWWLVFQRPFELEIDDFGGYDYAQIAFTREAALRRPQAWWARVWRALCTRSNYQLLLGTSFVSWVDLSVNNHWNKSERANSREWAKRFHKGLELTFENLWHAFFFPEAESLLWQTRFRNPDVPLSFKFSVLNSNNPKMLQYYRWNRGPCGHGEGEQSKPSYSTGIRRS